MTTINTNLLDGLKAEHANSLSAIKEISNKVETYLNAITSDYVDSAFYKTPNGEYHTITSYFDYLLGKIFGNVLNKTKKVSENGMLAVHKTIGTDKDKGYGKSRIRWVGKRRRYGGYISLYNCLTDGHIDLITNATKRLAASEFLTLKNKIKEIGKIDSTITFELPELVEVDVCEYNEISNKTANEKYLIPSRIYKTSIHKIVASAVSAGNETLVGIGFIGRTLISQKDIVISSGTNIYKQHPEEMASNFGLNSHSHWAYGFGGPYQDMEKCHTHTYIMNVEKIINGDIVNKIKAEFDKTFAPLTLVKKTYNYLKKKYLKQMLMNGELLV